MRYRIAAPGSDRGTGRAARADHYHRHPVPKRDREKNPDIYALIYVGLGRNHPDNARRIDHALRSLPSSARGAVRDPKVKALPIVQEKEKKLGWIEHNTWAENRTRAASVEGTAVVRSGSPTAAPRSRLSSPTPSPASMSRMSKTASAAFWKNWKDTREILRSGKRMPEPV